MSSTFLNKGQILSSVGRGNQNVAKRAENVLNRAKINFVPVICTNLGTGKHPEWTPQTSLPRQFLTGRDRRAAVSPGAERCVRRRKRIAQRVSFPVRSALPGGGIAARCPYLF